MLLCSFIEKPSLTIFSAVPILSILIVYVYIYRDYLCNFPAWEQSIYLLYATVYSLMLWLGLFKSRSLQVNKKRITFLLQVPPVETGGSLTGLGCVGKKNTVGVEGGGKNDGEKEKQHPRCTSLKFWNRGIKIKRKKEEKKQISFIYMFIYLFMLTKCVVFCVWYLANEPFWRK